MWQSGSKVRHDFANRSGFVIAGYQYGNPNIDLMG
jgi:hypothetical protein